MFILTLSVIFSLLPLAAGLPTNGKFNHGVELSTRCPLIISHRGSSGVLPEHTAEAYRQATRDGADVIECDLAVTSDLQLVCRHESWLSHSTDVAQHAEFADRKRNIMVETSEGTKNITDWFTVDFTLDELLTLRTVQDDPFRDPSFDRMYPIATLTEFMDISQSVEPHVGVHIELKQPSFFNRIFLEAKGTTFEDLVLNQLTTYGCTEKSHACFLQSFDESSLIRLTEKTRLPLVMLTWEKFDDTKYEEWANLGFYGLGPWKDQILPHWDGENGYKNKLQPATDMVQQCHRHGLRVHAYTFRNEDRYLSWNYSQDPYNELDTFYQLGIDGYFTDFPATAKKFMEAQRCSMVVVSGGCRMGGVQSSVFGVLVAAMYVVIQH